VSGRCIETVKSICENEGKFKIYLVCNKKPLGMEANEKLKIIEENFVVPKSKKEAFRDIRLKIKRGLLEAKENGPHHVMRVDADDLVSNRIVKYIKRVDNCKSYYINKGYFWSVENRYVIKNFKFNRYCGSSNIVFFEKEDFPESVKGKFNLDFFWLHRKVSKKLKKIGKNVGPLPFPGAIYVFPGSENISGNKDLANINAHDITNPRRVLWKIYGIRPLTEKISKEFSIKS
jgi:hypothetical protein